MKKPDKCSRCNCNDIHTRHSQRFDGSTARYYECDECGEILDDLPETITIEGGIYSNMIDALIEAREALEYDCGHVSDTVDRVSLTTEQYYEILDRIEQALEKAGCHK